MAAMTPCQTAAAPTICASPPPPSTRPACEWVPAACCSSLCLAAPCCSSQCLCAVPLHAVVFSASPLHPTCHSVCASFYNRQLPSVLPLSGHCRHTSCPVKSLAHRCRSFRPIQTAHSCSALDGSCITKGTCCNNKHVCQRDSLYDATGSCKTVCPLCCARRAVPASPAVRLCVVVCPMHAGPGCLRAQGCTPAGLCESCLLGLDGSEAGPS